MARRPAGISSGSAFHRRSNTPACPRPTLVGRDGRYLDVNRAFCVFRGYEREELLARGWEDVTFPEDLANDRALAADLDASRSAAFARLKRFRRRDGEPAFGELSVSAVRGG